MANIFNPQDELEADLLEEAIPVLDTLYDEKKDTEIPDDTLKQLCKIARWVKLGNPISDTAYDDLRKRLTILRPNSDVLSGHTASTKTVLKKMKHPSGLYSIDKANGSLEDEDDGTPGKKTQLKKWLDGCVAELKYKSQVSTNSTQYFAQSFKRDGLACRIYYVKGILVGAGTRSKDPNEGEDITEAIKYVKNVKTTLTLPLTLALTGELECSKTDFKKLNDDAEANGQKRYKNPRNYTGGTLGLDPIDPKRLETIQFVCHGIEEYDNAPYHTAIERAKWCNTILKIPFVRVEPFDYNGLVKMEALVPTLDYEVDGAVIEVNIINDGESLGRKNNGNPEWKLAWKFDEKHATPTIKNIRWQVGRSGKLTPVAEFDPVSLADTDVSNCTLHNVGRVIADSLGVGAVIEVYKSGKIIPYHHKTLKSANKADYPTVCPACSSKTEIVNGLFGFELYCVNVDCPGRNSRNFVHYLQTFGVKGTAESAVDIMLEAGLLKSYADFYKVTPEQLQKAGRSVRESILDFARIHMISEPEKEKDSGVLLALAKKVAKEKVKIPLGQFIACLGIDGASRGTGAELSLTFRSIEKVMDATKDDFLKVQNIGDTTAESLYNYFLNNRAQIDELLQYVDPQNPKSGKFTKADGKPMTFVFTGSPIFGKDYWIKKVEDEGGKVSTSVSKRTDVIVVGSDAGAKADKAQELKKAGAPIRIIDDINELKQMLGLDKDDDRAF